MVGAEILCAPSSIALPGGCTSAELKLLLGLLTALEMVTKMLNAVLVSNPVPNSPTYEDLSCSAELVSHGFGREVKHLNRSLGVQIPLSILAQSESLRRF